MRTLEPNDIMAISETTRSAADEPRVTCIVRDLTNPLNIQQRNVTLPASYTVRNLLEHISTDYGYKLESFNLLFERNANTELLNEKDRRLDELESTCSNSKRMKFQITELESGALPVKLNAKTPVGSVQFDELPIAATDCNGGIDSYQETSHFSSSVYSGPQPEFCGLVNQAMTCYLNSLLQTLYMTPEFRNALYSWKYVPDPSRPADKCIPYQLQRLFLQMQTGNHKSVETTPVTRSFGWDSSHSWQQHDVQELCRVMFDALEINWKHTQQADLINELYQGHLKDYVKCLECKSESFRKDAYLDIPLVIKPFGASKGYPSVEAALKSFVEPEILDGNNQYQCDKCDKKCDAHKGLKFVNFPYLLTLQLKRFDFDYNTMNRIKLNDRMTFPGCLDLNGLIDDNTMPLTPGPRTDPPRFEATCMYDDSIVDRDTIDQLDDTPPQELIAEKGEYIYELFSIMIHSGSAVGGHYYAYIKCFTNGQWYSFNDQSVTPITPEDIKKTYGGTGTGGIYSTTYTSSTNAYMLMYRKFDPHRNADFLTVEALPAHITHLMEIMEQEAEVTKQNRERERCTCKIATYVNHPTQMKRLHSILEIDKEESLDNAIIKARQMFELEGVVPLDCVRLVRYNCDLEYIERSFDTTEIHTIGQAVGGVKTMYAFELLLEIRQPTRSWQEFKLGGTTYKVHLVDLETSDVQPQIGVRITPDDKVADLKVKIVKVLGLPEDFSYMRCVLEKKSSGLLVPLTDDKAALRDISHSQGTKIYVDSALSETEDCQLPFKESRLHRMIDIYQNTIRLYLTVPTSSEIQRFLEKESTKIRLFPPKNYDKETEEGFDQLSIRNHNHTTTPAAPTESGNDIEPMADQLFGQNPFIDSSDNPPSYEELYKTCIACSGTHDSVCSCSQLEDGMALGASAGDIYNDSSVQTDSLLTTSTTLLGEPKEESTTSSSREGVVWDYCNDSSDGKAANSNITSKGATSKVSFAHGKGAGGDTAEETKGAEDVFFKVLSDGVEDSKCKTKVLAIQMDKRMTMKRFKHILQKKLSVSPSNFKMYKIYSNNQEIECSITTDNLNLLSDDSRMSVKLGRVLGDGEYKIKLYELELNAGKDESMPFLFELIVTRGMTIAQTKECVAEELRTEHDREVSPTRIRLRKKTWRNPHQVFLDDQTIEQDLSMISHSEMFMQVLDGLEPVSSLNEMLLFVQQWKPSAYEFGSMSEIIVPVSADVPQLKSKLSELGGIPSDSIEIAKCKGTFPGDVSVLDAHTTGLEWNAAVTYITSWPLYLDSGSMLIYRDRREELGVLTAEKRKEINLREANSSHYRPSTNSYFRKEKALKIYTHVDLPEQTTTIASSQPNELD